MCCTALMRGVLQPVDHQWMTERFRIAAGNRYRRLAAACDDQLPFSTVPSPELCQFRTLLVACMPEMSGCTFRKDIPRAARTAAQSKASQEMRCSAVKRTQVVSV